MLAKKAFIDTKLERVKISDNDPDSYDEETIKKWLQDICSPFSSTSSSSELSARWSEGGKREPQSSWRLAHA